MLVNKDNIVQDGVIQEVLGGNGPCLSFFSLIPYGEGHGVRLIIGAHPADECAAHFDKDSLAGLIKILRKVQKAMKQ